MSDLDWCLCGRATLEGELYCSDNCYYVDVGVEELQPTKFASQIRSQRPASINRVVIATMSKPEVSPASSPAQIKPWFRRISVDSCASSFETNCSANGSRGSQSPTPVGSCFAALAFKSRRAGASL
ncbi:hypothetical protein BC830DRAFT_1113551 [Chytriomyces sp. MP71]|nr:hypothetical protein BC830DRAFT_1113551 [Chytriomyces sp. MP71]